MHSNNIVVVAYNTKIRAYVVRYATGPIERYMQGGSRETKLGEFASHQRAMSFARDVAADAGGVPVHDLTEGRNRSGKTKPSWGSDRDRFHGNPNARRNHAGHGTRSTIRNDYGMTYLEWLYAAGYDLNSARSNAHALESAWRAGEDPSDYRASRNRSGSYNRRTTMAAKKRAKKTAKKTAKRPAKKAAKKTSKRRATKRSA